MGAVGRQQVQEVKTSFTKCLSNHGSLVSDTPESAGTRVIQGFCSFIRNFRAVLQSSFPN